MMTKHDVYALGNALVDIVVEVDESFFTKHGVEKGVMTLVDEARQMYLMQFFDAESSKMTAGGSAANTAIMVSQLGGRSAYSFLTARDDLGRFFIKDMQRNNVHIGLSHDDCPTGHSGRCLVMVNSDAERTMNTFLGVSSSFSKDQVDEHIIKEADCVYMEGYLVATSLGVEAMIKAKQIAIQNQVRTVLTLSDPNMVKFFEMNFDKVIGDGVDLLFCNEQEALLYSHTQRLQEACEKLQKIAKCFVVTLGAKGSLVYDGHTLFDIAPYKKLGEALDTTGAGDSFAGGFLYGLSQNCSYKEAGNIASVLAAHVVSQLGPRLEADQAKKALLDTVLGQKEML